MNEKLKLIHNASMEILKETGIVVNNSDVIDIIKSNGIKVSGKTAFFTENQIMKFIKMAPKKFNIYARCPNFNMVIGEDYVEYGPGYGCPLIMDAEGKKRSAVYDDYLKFLKLVHKCKHFNINGGILVQPSDIPSKWTLPLLTYSTVMFSDKCIQGAPGNAKEIEQVMKMLCLIFGNKQLLKQKPRIITLINTTSPLQLDKIALDTIMVCAEYMQPLIITPGPMAGATGPITLAGNIALGNAEALAGIAIVQMINKGTPVIYGMHATTTDMRSGCVSIGTPGCALESVYTGRLAKMYDLPSRSGGANTDAKFVGAQSGYESMLSLMASRQEKVNFILHSAGIMDSYGSMSFEQFIVDLEIISMVEYFVKGIEINENNLAVNLIEEIGNAGEFLTSEHTLENCRKVPFMPEISLRGILKAEKEPKEVFEQNINKRITKMEEDYKKPEFDSFIKSQLQEFLIKNVGVGQDFLKI